MIQFALGIFTGAFITLVVALMFAARDGDDKAQKLRQQEEEIRRIRSGGMW